MDRKFIIHEAVLYKGQIARIEDYLGVDAERENLYLVQFPNHMYRCIKESDLEVYVGYGAYFNEG